MKRLLPFALSLGFLSACFSAPIQQNTSTPSLQTLNALSNAPQFHSVDGEGDSLTVVLQKDFPRGQASNTLLTASGQLRLDNPQAAGQFVSPALKAPFQFRSLTPGWDSQGPSKVWVRTSADQRNWSSWKSLKKENDLLVVPSNWIQYRVTMPPRSTFEGLNFLFGNPVSLQGPLRNATDAPKPNVVSRQDWGAKPPKGAYDEHTPTGIVIHHTWKPTQAQYTGGGTIRGVQRYHQNTKKWNDIGYHFLVGPDGVIFQGRPETVIGAHSSPNTGMIGICVIGDYDPKKDPFTPKIRESLVQLLTWLTAEYKIDTQNFFGHRDFSPKSCPGDEVYKHLNPFREEVKKNLGLDTFR